GLVVLAAAASRETPPAPHPHRRRNPDEFNRGGPTDMSRPTVVRGAVAAQIEDLDLDGAFVEAEARSRAGQDCEIWCRRDPAGRPMAYRVLVWHPGKTLGQGWERIALLFATAAKVGTPDGGQASGWQRRVA